jgi:mono/diheme cytochrome c family protein
MSVFRFTVLLAALAVSATIAGAADGKAVFLDKKCNLCHSIDSQQIKKTSDKMKGPDLSNAGGMVESADWLKKFIKKEVQLDGEDHKREFKGTDEELDAVAQWLVTLKTS